MDNSNNINAPFRNFLNVLFKRKLLIVLFAITILVIVGIGTFAIEPTYMASSQILVKLGRENLYVPTKGDANPIISLNTVEQMNSEIELLKSQALAEMVVKALSPELIYGSDVNQNHNLKFYLRALKKLLTRQQPLSLEEKAILQFKEDLVVEGIKNSKVIEVGFKHRDPQMAANIVNKLMDIYLHHHLEVHKTPQSHEFFRQQVDVLKNKLEQSEKRLTVLKNEYAVTSLGEQQSLLLRQINELRSELNGALSRQAETKNRLVRLRQQLNATAETISQGEEVDHNPYLISNLQARLVELQLKEKQLLSKYTDNSRLVQNNKAEIKIVKEKLMEQEDKRYGKSRSGVNPTYQHLQEELFRNETEIRALTARVKALNGQLNNTQQELDKLNQVEANYYQLKQEVELDRKNYGLYLTKYEESRISNVMDNQKIANISILKSAKPPLKPVNPNIFMNLSLGIFLAFIGGPAFAFFLEYIRDTVERPEDIENYLKTPVLTSIPEHK
jgi:uncharacterized protein involved in exopolysaccharide biosynthesis